MMRRALCIVVLAASLPLPSSATSPAPPAQADRPGTHPAWIVGKKPNVLIVWGDDIEWFTCSRYGMESRHETSLALV